MHFFLLIFFLQINISKSTYFLKKMLRKPLTDHIGFDNYFSVELFQKIEQTIKSAIINHLKGFETILVLYKGYSNSNFHFKLSNGNIFGIFHLILLSYLWIYKNLAKLK